MEGVNINFLTLKNIQVYRLSKLKASQSKLLILSNDLAHIT